MMKAVLTFIILLFVWFSAPRAQAQILEYSERTPVSNEQANEYYEKCMAEPDPIMNRAEQNEMCACFSANFKMVMSVEEMELMTDVSTLGEEARGKILVYVHAPCISLPVKEIVRLNCVSNKRLRAHIPNMDALCDCIAEDMADYIYVFGPDLYAKARHIGARGNVDDPIQATMNSWEYRREHRDVLKACINIYETVLVPKE